MVSSCHACAQRGWSCGSGASQPVSSSSAATLSGPGLFPLSAYEGRAVSTSERRTPSMCSAVSSCGCCGVIPLDSSSTSEPSSRFRLKSSEPYSVQGGATSPSVCSRRPSMSFIPDVGGPTSCQNLRLLPPCSLHHDLVAILQIKNQKQVIK